MKLIATKSLKYATRRLTAGDEFDATDMHARILVGARKARYAPKQEKVEPPPLPVPRPPVKAEPEKDVGEELIDRLREKAESLGIDVDGRWGPARLQSEIALASRK
jgi:hypothetical protein